MKILLDTNVLISAFITSGGHSHEILTHAIHQHKLYYTDYILDEFKEKFKTKFHFPPTVIRDLVEFIANSFLHGKTAVDVPKVCRDPDDDQVLADAVVNEVDLILTGDEDLLILKTHQGIRLLPPKDYWSL
ncbi:MAG: putative toxin-antitoxin system toxin component, PIN family [Elusimicrobia bacterium]|nr:putative toxin-antitoxin system toxin component, PIN family [Elusimicrobiota bacterium]